MSEKEVVLYLQEAIPTPSMVINLNSLGAVYCAAGHSSELIPFFINKINSKLMLKWGFCSECYTLFYYIDTLPEY